MARLTGTPGNDTLTGHRGADVIQGLDGDDRLTGNEGDDRLVGGGGDDVLRPGTGADTMFGGAGDDVAIITELDSATPDRFDGGGGADKIDLTKVPSNFFNLLDWYFDGFVFTVRNFGDPNDSPAALTFTGVETIVASNAGDHLFVSNYQGPLTLYGEGGDDWITTGPGDDRAYGGAGNDRLNGQGGRDLFFGGDGDDEIGPGLYTTGLVDGGAGTDTGVFNASVDLAAGWALNAHGERIKVVSIENVTASLDGDGATIRGNDGGNVFNGSFSSHAGTFDGRGGDDVINGGDAADVLFGSDGNDVLDGAYGADRLTGGAGADTFRFTDDFFSRTVQTDTITDFVPGDGDRIDLIGVDANTTTDSTDAFQWIGAGAFSGSAGQLRYEVVGSETYVQADTNGDGGVDFTIRLTGAIALQRGDFILAPGDAWAGHVGPVGAHFDHAAASPGYVDPVLP